MQAIFHVPRINWLMKVGIAATIIAAQVLLGDIRQKSGFGYFRLWLKL